MKTMFKHIDRTIHNLCGLQRILLQLPLYVEMMISLGLLIIRPMLTQVLSQWFGRYQALSSNCFLAQSRTYTILPCKLYYEKLFCTPRLL